MKSNIKEYLNKDKKIHLIGIGGVSMAPLAEDLLERGIPITGSDVVESETVKHLESLGVPIEIGHKETNVKGADAIIRTAAVHDDNPEIVQAKKDNIPVFERAQAWGAIMQDYPNAVCISGTHGKTTTTSMISQILLADGQDPSIMIGGELPLIDSSFRIGHGDTIVLEACEYCDSFLSFFPTIAVVLEVDKDHMDFFEDIQAIKSSFRKFAELVPEDGYVIALADSDTTMEALEGLDRNVITFGIDKGDIHTQNLEYNKGLASFDVIKDGEFYTHLDLKVPGEHNVHNALAACAAVSCLDVPGESVKKGLESFYGARRRFEKKGSYNGADIFDDYAHHPNEIKALYNSVKDLGYDRIIFAFQPHTYTRTIKLFDDFVDILKQPDLSILMEIYPAREINTTGISSNDLSNEIPDSIYCSTLEEVTERFKEIAQPGDLIVTVGAGDIYQSGEKLVEETVQNKLNS